MAVLLDKLCVLLVFIIFQNASIVLTAVTGQTFQKFGESSQNSELCSEEIHEERPHGGGFRPMPPGDWKACGDGAAGDPLYLTPFLKNGSIAKAVELSRVQGVGGNTSYSGYLTVDERFGGNLFFWFFPAQENPADAPVVLWLQGGPGASSLFGLFVEIGPLAATKDGEFTEMAVTWNKRYSLLFVDNPVGTGFSFAAEAGYARNEPDVARNLYAGLTQFFAIYTAYAKNDFYAAGESYAGKYIPSVSQRIVAGNAAGGATHINFKGMAIGDGWTDPLTQFPSYPDLLHQMSVIDAAQADEARAIAAAFAAAVRARRFADAFRTFDAFLLGTLTPHATWLTNVSGSTDHYSVLRSRLPPSEAYYAPALVRDAVRRAIHVGNTPYSSGRAVLTGLVEDVADTALPAFLSVLNADGGRYKVLVYNGQFDIVVGVPLTEAMLAAMDWPGRGEFRTAERKVWRVRGDDDPEVAGYARAVRNLRQVVVRGAGHMVPFDQPERALDMITRFIDGVPFA